MKIFCLIALIFCSATPPGNAQGVDPIERRQKRSASEIDANNDVVHWVDTSPSLSAEDRIRLAIDLEKKWSVKEAEFYVGLVTTVSYDLFRLLTTNSVARELSAQWAEKILDRLGEASSIAADRALRGLDRSALLESLSQPSLLDLVPAEKSLDSYLGLIQRAETQMGSINPAKVPTFLPSRPEVPAGVPQENGVLARPITDPILRAAFSKNIETHEENHRVRSIYFHFSPDRDNNLQKIETSFSRFVQRRFTMSDEDLRVMNSALKRNVHDVILRDKLVTLAYRGQNPFLGLPDDLPTGTSGPSLEALTRKSPASANGALASGHSRGPVASTSAPAAVEKAQSTSPRSLPYLPLAGVLAAGVVLWWFISRSRPG